jgi:hypothetical protein
MMPVRGQLIALTYDVSRWQHVQSSFELGTGLWVEIILFRGFGTSRLKVSTAACQDKQGLDTHILIKLGQQMKATIANCLQNIANIIIAVFLTALHIALPLDIQRRGPGILARTPLGVVSEAALVSDLSLLAVVTGPLAVAFLLATMTLCACRAQEGIWLGDDLDRGLPRFVGHVELEERM